MEKNNVLRIINIVIMAIMMTVLSSLLYAKDETSPQYVAMQPPPFPSSSEPVVAENDLKDSIEITPEMLADGNNLNNTPPSPQMAAAPVNETAMKSAAIMKKIATTDEKKLLPPVVTNKELKKLKTTAWVVQLGTFKDKNNARHFADKLRAAGYKAFVQEAKKDMRVVYIGPEFKQSSAMQLSNKIAQQMKLQGIVVSYKPLEL